VKIRLLNSLISISWENCFKLKDIKDKGHGIFNDVITTEHLKNKLVELGRREQIRLWISEGNSKASILLCGTHDKLILNLPLIKLDSQIYDINKFDNKDEEIEKESKETSQKESSLLYKEILRKFSILLGNMSIPKVNNEGTYPKGIYENVYIQNLIEDGFEIVYLFPYAHKSSFKELMKIRMKLKYNSLICVGGRKVRNENMQICCIENGYNALTVGDPEYKKSSKIEDRHWIFIENSAFGFSQNEIHLTNMFKLNFPIGSLFWNLNGISGGHLGSLPLASNYDYEKIILVRY
jgi:hypothetical protein